MSTICIYHHNCADGIDVSQIAKRFGGGGHRNAAGFKLPLAVVYDKVQFTPTEA